MPIIKPKARKKRPYPGRLKIGPIKRILISSNSLYRIDEAARIAGLKNEKILQIAKQMMEHGVKEQEIFHKGKILGRALREIVKKSKDKQFLKNQKN